MAVKRGCVRALKIKMSYLKLTFEDNRGVGADKQSTGTSTSGGPCSTFSVDGNVAGNNNSIAAVP